MERDDGGGDDISGWTLKIQNGWEKKNWEAEFINLLPAIAAEQKQKFRVNLEELK